MSNSEKPRAKLGDVIEVATSAGLAYAQFVNKERMHGALIRVLPGLFRTRPADIQQLVQQVERFYVFFPLTAALRAGAVTRVGTFSIPEPARAFPLMRLPGIRGKDGRPETWWLWDGEREWQVDRLGDREKRLSIASVVNDTLLKERIASGWKPEDDA